MNDTTPAPPSSGGGPAPSSSRAATPPPGSAGATPLPGSAGATPLPGSGATTSSPDPGAATPSPGPGATSSPPSSGGAAPPSSEGAPSRRLGKYDLLEEIGHGGMATVYRGHDPRLRRDVAVKVIHPHLRENLEVAKRFVTEARAVAMLRHPNIVEIYDVSDEGERERFLVAELVSGGNMRKLLQESGALPAEVAAAIGFELAAALEHAHQKGVVHRDVKAENVLFGRGEPAPGRAAPRAAIKLTDFGIAKMLDQQGMTATGQVLGSPAYMSPEQIEGGAVDERSDVFALGVLLYESMTGKLPFQGKNPAQVLRRVLDGAFTPVDVERPTAGACWAQIVGRALAHEPAGRFASMGELRAAIAAEFDALGLGPPDDEIAAYLDDPAGYEKELAGRLLPRLLARGKAAHRAGDVVATAGHFNRALALRPDDPALVSLVTGFSRSQARKQLARRAALSLLAASTVGAAAGLTVKLVSQARGDSPPAASASVKPEPPAPSASVAGPLADPSASAAPAPSASHRLATPSVSPARPPAPAATPPAPSQRAVELNIDPQTALVSIDRAAPVEGFLLMKEGARMMSVGTHTISIVPKKGSQGGQCCDELSVPFEVPPGEPDEVVRRSFPLRRRPATLVSEGPSTAQIVCMGTSVKGSAAASYTVKIYKNEDSLDCALFQDGALVGKKKVVVRAGESVTVVWGTR
jgi:eukaryotic-like serine/threonine-protein kinase